MHIGDGLGTIPAARLGEDAIHMGLHGGLTHEQILPDLGVGTPLGDQAEDLCLSLGQAVGQGTTPVPFPGNVATSTVGAWTAGSSTAWPEAAASRARPMVVARRVLGEVPDRPRTQRPDDGLVVGIGREHHHLGLGMIGGQISFVASTPSTRGMRRSIKTTSGSSATSKIASPPSATDPTTSMPGMVFNRVTRPSRTTVWSSATTTLTGTATCTLNPPHRSVRLRPDLPATRCARAYLGDRTHRPSCSGHCSPRRLGTDRL